MSVRGTGSTVRLCGALEVEVNGRALVAGLRGPQARLVLAYLIAGRSRPISRSELIVVLWPERHPRDPHATLRPILSGLRQSLGAEVLVGKEQVRLVLPEPVWVDTEEALAAVVAARAAAGAGDWKGSCEASSAALELLRGGFLPGYEGEWIESRRRELETVEFEALEWAARSGLALGGTSLGGALQAAGELIARSPYRESGHHLLMEALAASGNVAEGLRVYDDLRCRLRDELGTMPARELQLLHARLLGAEPSGATGTPGQLPLPASLARAGDRGAFVGRELELERLRAVWRATGEGKPAVALLAGEPGIGKTRLAAEFARGAHADGAIVLYGRCDEEALSGYQPFVEALSAWASGCSPDELRSCASACAAELASLLPELGRRLPGLQAPARAAPEFERYRLLDAVRELLGAIAVAEPVLLVLDDLHWADLPTLLMLRHLSRAPEGTRVLVLGTYRDVELGRAHPLAAVADDLRREHSSERVSLGGLAEHETVALIDSRAGEQVSGELARAIHGETDGNPFFVEELLRHLAESATSAPDGPPSNHTALTGLGLPEGVKAVIERRLARLGLPAVRAMQIASVIGRDFELDVVELVADASGDGLAEVFEEPFAAGLIEELPGSPGRFRFAHALIREVLYGQLTAVRRARLHRRVGEALEQLDAAEIDAQLPALAHHFCEAAAAGDTNKAIEYARRAAERALTRLAYEEAAGHHQRALKLLEHSPVTDEPLRCELLLGLGDAQMKAGTVEQARATFARAAELARELKTPELLARAALGFGTNWLLYLLRAEIDDALIALLDDALACLPPEPTTLRARVMSRLAWELYFTYDTERMAALVDAAVEIGRQTGDTATLAQALCTKALTMLFEGYGLERPEERLQVATQALRLSERSGDGELVLWARSRRLVALMDLGDFAGVDEEIAAFRELAQAMRIRSYTWYVLVWEAMRALMDGRFADAESLAGQALAVGQETLGPGAVEHFGIQIMALRFYTGQLEGIDVGLASLAAQIPTPQPGLQAGLATVYALAGRRSEAQAELDRLAPRDFAVCPRDANWLATAYFLAWTCALVGDAHAAGALYEQLKPYAGQCVRVSGTAAVCYGSLWRSLAQLAVTTGAWVDAEEQFEAALSQNAAIGSQPELAQTQLDYARLLARRAEPHDLPHAAELVDTAITTARELGMTALEQSGTALAEELAAHAPGPVEPSSMQQQ